MMKNNKARNTAIGIIILVIVIILIIYVVSRFEFSFRGSKVDTEQNNQIQNNEVNQESVNYEIDKDFIANIEKIDSTIKNIDIEKLNELNKKIDEYYLENYDQEIFMSQYSYLMKSNGVEATIFDIVSFTGIELPEEFDNTVIHFVKPKSLLHFPNVTIKEEEGEVDLEVLTVYTAVPLESGNIYISSKYDKGGILTPNEYQEFVLSNSPLHGEIRSFSNNDDNSNYIKAAVGAYDEEVLGGNVKYLSYDDKYAFIVISSKHDFANIKQFLLQNYNSNWNVVMSDLESNPKYKIFVNASYPDFNLDMLPIYNLAEMNIISNLDNVVEQFIEQNVVQKNDTLTYGCACDKFIYMEFESGYKILAHLNDEGVFDIYSFERYTTALQKMVELDSINPPTFIVNFEN